MLSAETPLNFYQTARNHIQGNGNILTNVTNLTNLPGYITPHSRKDRILPAKC
jgi:hypothetical protein